MKGDRYFWTASLATFALIMAPTVVTISSLSTEPVLSSVSVLAAAFGLITWSVRVMWTRSPLIFWGLGLQMVVNTVSLADVDSSTWTIWTVGLMTLAAMVLARYMEFLAVRGEGPGFEDAQERRASLDLAMLAFNGISFYAAALVMAVLLFLAVPLLSFPGVSVWLIGALAVGFMVLLTWLSRAEPS